MDTGLIARLVIDAAVFVGLLGAGVFIGSMFLPSVKKADDAPSAIPSNSGENTVSQ